MLTYIKKMLSDRNGDPNTKLHFGALFAIVMIIGLFVSVDSALYQTFALCTMGLLGLSVIDNLTSPKIEVNKNENKNSQSNSTTTTDVTSIANNAINNMVDIVKAKDKDKNK